MRTIIFKPLILVFLVLGTSIASLNATTHSDGGNKDAIKIELHSGFTIEDIIQDLQDNANITNITTVYLGVNIYTLKYNPKIVNKSTLIQFLDAHPGVHILCEEKESR